MNVLGHIHVALAGGRDDPEYLLGAVLPDLAPMAGVRLRARSDLPGSVGEGVRCHLRADRAFHAHAGFRRRRRAPRRGRRGRRLRGRPGPWAMPGGSCCWTAPWSAPRSSGPSTARCSWRVSRSGRLRPGTVPGGRRSWPGLAAAAACATTSPAGWPIGCTSCWRRPRLRLPEHQVAAVADALAAATPRGGGCAGRPGRHRARRRHPSSRLSTPSPPGRASRAGGPGPRVSPNLGPTMLRPAPPSPALAVAVMVVVLGLGRSLAARAAPQTGAVTAATPVVGAGGERPTGGRQPGGRVARRRARWSPARGRDRPGRPQSACARRCAPSSRWPSSSQPRSPCWRRRRAVPCPRDAAGGRRSPRRCVAVPSALVLA